MAAVPKPAFRSYIPAKTSLREFSVRALLLGTALGVVFGMSSLYLALKVGLTVSASIPVAVISITVFRLLSKLGWGKDATILEHNLAQTAGSAGESIAFGVGVTMPAILILGFDLEIYRVLLVGVLGGLLGILMMIPLRRSLIVLQHGELKYPEGTACAEVLKSGANDESLAAADPSHRQDKLATNLSAKTIFAGFGIGLAYKTLNSLFRLWKDSPSVVFRPPLKNGSVSAEISPELLGVGYIIGPQIAGVMAAGGVLSYLVLIPLIRFFGEGLGEPLSPAVKLIREMGPGEIRSNYILYIGAGAVAAGGIISLVRSLPTIWHGLKAGLADLMGDKSGTSADGSNDAQGGTVRTDRDLPMRFVLIGVLVLLTAITLAPPLHMNLVGAGLIVLLGFLFVTVSSRLTGEIGSSSNPVSGMMIATLLVTCLVFLALGWTGKTYYVTALSVGAIVCIACSNGGTTSQDLKTGYLVGATPRLQQIAILVGAFASAIALGPTLLALNRYGTAYVDAAEVMPNLRVSASDLAHLPRRHLTGPQAQTDTREFAVWHQDDPGTGNSREFLLDDQGKAVWYVDPGINGTVRKLPDGTLVNKFEAPKATLVSYIIKGILDRRLPWGLVLFGVMLSITLELCGVGSLAFAVGVYLPIATSLPIFVGGMIRWWADGRDLKRLEAAGLTPEEITAEGDKSPGVLMASGYIAGGAIAGIVIAFVQGLFEKTDAEISNWSKSFNPFFEGTDTSAHIYADALSLIPYVILCGLLALAARRMILTDRPAR
jgi:putative OPT family oligopeptide transporter